ncbi:MAG: hypothetical protein JO101_04540 [Candidatus Eremiobacteraeota bacterium]|nr:hypothetical protein [Candidatus Eremiobacteraeota bacterium]MBV8354566.1 hypothetical protein [Candidatus Eremiobacteraeota bacterium]
MQDLDVTAQQRFLGFDHIDTRVASLTKVESFYDRLMPMLGLTRKRSCFVDASGEWHVRQAGEGYNTVEYYTPAIAGEASFFVGFIERSDHPTTFTRIAFRVERGSLERWLDVLRELGAREIELSDDMSGYPAIFFEDPGGTKLELVARNPA